MTYKETNEVIPTAEQERRDRKAERERLYRSCVTDPIDSASAWLSLASVSLRETYNDPTSADRAKALADQAEELLADLLERDK